MMASVSITLLGSPEPGIEFVLRHWGDSLVLFLTAKPTAVCPCRVESPRRCAPCCPTRLLPAPPAPWGEGVWLHLRLRLMDVLPLEWGLLQKAAGLKLHFIFMSPGHSPVHFCAPCLGVWQAIFTTGREQAAPHRLASTVHSETAVGRTRGVPQPSLCLGVCWAQGCRLYSMLQNRFSPPQHCPPQAHCQPWAGPDSELSSPKFNWQVERTWCELTLSGKPRQE